MIYYDPVRGSALLSSGQEGDWKSSDCRPWCPEGRERLCPGKKGPRPSARGIVIGSTPGRGAFRGRCCTGIAAALPGGGSGLLINRARAIGKGWSCRRREQMG